MMETINIPKYKLGQVIADVEKLVSDVEDLAGNQDDALKHRLSDIKKGEVEGKTEKELDDYLKKRGVKID
ncbi:hypothetical protein GF345_00565 [Candidatus Woesearchaeota archaeon]|nr:hypothetical protein [Candidatus Woesearchaeota archaeon]